MIRRGRAGRTAYTDLITAEHPTYLHELFRQATNLLGDNASFEELAMAMNANSAARANLPTLTLDKFTLYRWFKKNRGKEKRMKERPLLTEEHKRARLELAERLLTLIEEGAFICYLDEKLFYLFMR